MLDSQTKKRIDDCRDILVGKITDPKSQVEQITIAMIYKFMDDMDLQSEEYGGSRQFFVGDYQKYSWSKIFSPRVDAYEMLNLYGEGIEKMSENPNLNPLFRSIFKDAYLPYRDPETLKLFLKTIDGFSYEHSENLGDAYEYLLSVLGSQGGAGQFRTPRHIIDFIVDLVEPKKGDRILDPACGTSGFLISSYKRILERNTDKKLGDKLSSMEKKQLLNSIYGYDLDPNMVRLSLVNLFLHGFTEDELNVIEYDSLTSEDRWNEYFDVILANPPFMTPKGGIRPSQKFTISSNRAEFLFVSYIVNHLSPSGRAGIIVPEGFMFKTNSLNYSIIRKELIEKGLYGVISLPSGVFLPYSPIRTFILLIDKEISKLTDNVVFLEVENDGFELNVSRNISYKNDLPNVIEKVKEYKNQILKKNQISNEYHLIKKTNLIQNKSILIKEKYETENEIISKFPYVSLDEIIQYEQPQKYSVSSTNYSNEYSIPVLTAGKTFILGYTNEENGIFRKDLPVIIFDDFTTSIQFVDFPFKVKSSAMKILHIDRDFAIPEYIYHIMKGIDFNPKEHKRYWISEYSKIKIPLPTLEKQKEIVEELEQYQKEIEKSKLKIEQLNNSIEDRINKIWGE